MLDGIELEQSCQAVTIRETCINRVRSASDKAQVLATIIAGVMMPTMAATTCCIPNGTSCPTGGIPSKENTDAEELFFTLIYPYFFLVIKNFFH